MYEYEKHIFKRLKGQIAVRSEALVLTNSIPNLEGRSGNAELKQYKYILVGRVEEHRECATRASWELR